MQKSKAEKAVMPCVICGGVSKYKCPKCESKYCSVACCTTHKETCTLGAAKVAEPIFTSFSLDVLPPAFVVREGDPVLSKIQKDAFDNSHEGLKDILKTSRPQTMIKRILAAEDMYSELKKCRMNPDFEQLVQQVIDVLGVESDAVSLADTEP
jgi:hypothetical protein